MKVGSGTSVGQIPRWLRIVRENPIETVLVGIIGVLSIIVTFHILTSAAFGSCTTVPEVPLISRTNEICQALNRGHPDPGCQWKVKRLFPIEIIPVGHLPESAYFELYIRGEFIGTFPIEEAVPVDLTTLDAGMINRLLQYRIGNAAVQGAIAEKFGRRGVFYIDRIVEWIEPPIEGQPAYLAGIGAIAR